jgi:hypothetical protein
MKEKYPVSGFTRDKEAIYVNGIRIFVPAEYDNFKAAIPKKRHKQAVSKQQLIVHLG